MMSSRLKRFFIFLIILSEFNLGAIGSFTYSPGEVYIVAMNNITKVERVRAILPQILETPEWFVYNFDSIIELKDFRRIYLTSKDQMIRFIFFANCIEELDLIFEEVSFRNDKLMLRVLIRISTTSDVELGKLEERLKSKVASVPFFQGNPVLLQIVLESKEHCFAAYRIDNINQGFVVKEIKKHSPFTMSCFSEALESLIDSSISHNFGGTKLIVSAVNTTTLPFDVKFDIDSNGVPSFQSGLGVEVLRGMQRVLNFTVTEYISPGWPTRHPVTGKWEGFAKDFIEEKIDLVITSTVHSKKITDVVSFPFATHTYSLHAFYRKLRIYRTNKFPILSPFQIKLWLTILVWIIVNFAAYKMSRRFIERPCEFLNELGSSGFTPLCLQGTQFPPFNTSLRTIYVFQLFVALVLHAAFEGTLISYLSINKLSISSVEDLLREKHGFKFGTIPEVKQVVDLSDDAYNTSAQEIFRKVSTFKAFPTEKILSEKFAFLLSDTNGLSKLYEENLKNPEDICHIGLVPLYKSTQFQGPVVKKNSHLLKSFGFSILKMLESGNIKRMKQRNIPSRPTCKGTPNSNPITIDDINFACLVFLLGILLSISSICLEYFVSKMYNLRTSWVD